MKQNKKHAAPLRCHREVKTYGKDPLHAYCCRIGARCVKPHKCKGCEENVAEMIAGALVKAFEGLADCAKATAKALEAKTKQAGLTAKCIITDELHEIKNDKEGET